MFALLTVSSGVYAPDEESHVITYGRSDSAMEKSAQKTLALLDEAKESSAHPQSVGVAPNFQVSVEKEGTVTEGASGQDREAVLRADSGGVVLDDVLTSEDFSFGAGAPSTNAPSSKGIEALLGPIERTLTAKVLEEAQREKERKWLQALRAGPVKTKHKADSTASFSTSNALSALNIAYDDLSLAKGLSGENLTNFFNKLTGAFETDVAPVLKQNPIDCEKVLELWKHLSYMFRAVCSKDSVSGDHVDFLDSYWKDFKKRTPVASEEHFEEAIKRLNKEQQERAPDAFASLSRARNQQTLKRQDSGLG